MRILVVGATGILGRHVIPRLVERGHAVRAVVRRTEQAGILRGLGVETAPGDILDQDSLYASARGCDAALHLATAIPRGPGGDWSANDRIRREGTRNLLAAATLAHVTRYLQQSITFLYGDTGAALVDESAPLRPSPRIQSAADMEELVRGSALEWLILRGGSFYGPGTGREDDWRAQARAGTLPLPGDGSALLSLIHVADMARAVVLAVESAPARTIANVVDDQPVSYRALYGYIAVQAGTPEPPAGGPPTASLACANARIKELLGWQPAYPTYRSGLA
ncbi:MAG TPA: NAD(P)-dependent oxidoreductase [Ktedonobacterales bacterium]|nr:NAD(P)-dependent oxidoreductase [Ktedonobacterales bacterium]